MFLSKAILLFGLCWVVECDLLDLYVQHMDETMKTIVYQKNHVKNLARGRNKRNAPVSVQVAGEETFYKFGNFKKQKLEVDEGWNKDEGKDLERIFISKDDGLDFKNEKEENLDLRHYEILGKESTDGLTIPMKTELESKEKYKGKGKKVLLKNDDGLEVENAAEESDDAIEDFELIGQVQGETLETDQEFSPEYQTGSDSIVKVFEPGYNEAIDMGDKEIPILESNSKSIVDNSLVEMEEEKESEIDEDVNLDFEIVSKSEESGSEKSGWNPSLKRNPKAIGGRVPKKYAPREMDVKFRQKLTNKESNTTTTRTTNNSTLTANATRTKRSAKNPIFSRQEKLDDDGFVVLEWDPTDEDIVTFRVTAKTLGYVGIGFNDKSHMKGADILLAWIDNHNGDVNLLDSHGIEERNAAPVTDVSQDVEVLGGIQNETHTIITFSRRWSTCDPQDRKLTEDTIHVLWALHETDPELNTAAGHGERRGGRPLRLKAPAPHPAPNITGSDVRQWDIKLNQFNVTNSQDTIYWCKIFKAPLLNEKHHMIGYKPHVEKASEPLVHHIILYECASKAQILEKQARLAGAPCYSPTMPREWDSCLEPVVAWARGSKGEWFPDHVGIPIAEHREGSYYMLEVHYNNPELKEVVDSSGITLYLTPKLRPQEAGILVTGVAVGPLHMIPPRQKEYATAGYCTPHCTKKMFPDEGINIVSVVLHSHLAGRRLGLKHIRQGKELPKIVQDNHFDFNYQQSHTLEKEVKVLPGDELVAECVYGTLDRAYPTLGGYAATQEMCLAFMVHYPRTPLAACYSMTPVKDLFRTLGVHSFRGVTVDHLEKLFLTTGTDAVTLPTIIQQQPIYPVARPGGEIDEEMIKQTETALRAITTDEYDDDNVFARLVIEKPEEFRGRTLAEHMLAMPWTEELLARSIERSLYHGRHMTFCRKRDDKLAVPSDIQMFPNFTALPEANETVCDASKMVSSSSGLNASLVSVVLVISTFHWRLLIRL